MHCERKLWKCEAMSQTDGPTHPWVFDCWVTWLTTHTWKISSDPQCVHLIWSELDLNFLNSRWMRLLSLEYEVNWSWIISIWSESVLNHLKMNWSSIESFEWEENDRVGILKIGTFETFFLKTETRQEPNKEQTGITRVWRELDLNFLDLRWIRF